MYVTPLPHAYDRYRLIGLILNYRQAHLPKLSQREFQELTGVHQTQISRLESLEKLEEKACHKRPLNRAHLLAFSVRGLKMSYRDASLLLWLAEGGKFRPWTAQELRAAEIPKPDAETVSEMNLFRNRPRAAWYAIVDLLGKTFARDLLDNRWGTVDTHVLHGNTPTSRRALYDVLERMEGRPGQRMLVSKYPSILVSTDMTKSSELVQTVQEPERSELIRKLTERRSTFHMNLEKYGERAIHSVSSLRRFVSEGFKHTVSADERKERVRSLMRHLDGYYPKLQVGLADVEPEVEIAIKSTEFAVVRGTARDLSNHPETIVCGPSYLFWDDDMAVVTFFLDFEKEWEKLERKGRTEKKAVIKILEDVLSMG
jgi:hypothetical protein